LPGQLLTVSDTAAYIVVENPFVSARDESSVAKFVGRTGVVLSVNMSLKSVQLLFFVPATASKHCLWLPITALLKPQRMWADPCIELRAGQWQDFAASFVRNERALSIRKVFFSPVGCRVKGVNANCAV
jgi:hypothetical protein